ncbi:MAG: hypothetical protein WDM85_12045 [Caulobacteraceae bacterium]
MPAPSPVLPPKLDYDALGMIPLNSPVAARTAMDGDRIFAERTPEGPAPNLPDEPSASEAAAAAVIQRLESILSEPTVAPAVAETPLADPVSAPFNPPDAKPETFGKAEPAEPPVREVRNELPPITFLEVKTSRRGWQGAFALVILGVIGVGLLALAAIFGFQPRGIDVLGFAPRTAGLAVGLLGIICFSVAAYYLLDRLGLPRDPPHRLDQRSRDQVAAGKRSGVVGDGT